MFRDRTNLYISYRRTYPHHLNAGFDAGTGSPLGRGRSQFDNLEEEENLIGEHHNDIELATLPPSFLDVADEIDENIDEINKLIEKLQSLYKKNLLPGFNDRTMDEEEIEKLNYSITKKFFSSDSLVKKFRSIKLLNNKLKPDDINMIDNMQKNYALKIQQLSSNFRKIQNNYIKFLKKDEFEQTPRLKSSLQSYNPAVDETEELETYSREAIKESSSILQQSSSINDSIIRQREQEITKLAQGVLEVSQIFKEMQNMVIEQGTIVDRIDYNIENTKVDVKQASNELNKATRYQKRTQKCKLIFLLSLIVLLLFMIVVLKPRNHGTSGCSEVSRPDNSKTNPQNGDIPDKDRTPVDNDELTGSKADLAEESTNVNLL